jgi:hypothetical protein
MALINLTQKCTRCIELDARVKKIEAEINFIVSQPIVKEILLKAKDLYEVLSQLKLK